MLVAGQRGEGALGAAGQRGESVSIFGIIHVNWMRGMATGRC
jgi:hypothetical protein